MAIHAVANSEVCINAPRSAIKADTARHMIFAIKIHNTQVQRHSREENEERKTFYHLSKLYCKTI